MANTQILPTGVQNAPGDWVLPNTQIATIGAIFAHFNGAGAAGAYVPTVDIISDSGHTVISVVQDSTIAAGSSAEASWAPFLKSAAAASAASVMSEGGADVASVTVPNPWTTKRVVTLSAFFGDATYFAMDASNQGVAILVDGFYSVIGELAIEDPGAGHVIPPSFRIYQTIFGTGSGAPSGNSYAGGTVMEYPNSGSIDNAYNAVGGVAQFFLETHSGVVAIPAGQSVGIALQSVGGGADWAYSGFIYLVHCSAL